MATYKHDGSMRNHDDTILWKQILQKEAFANTLHKNYQKTDEFAQTHGQRFGAGKFHNTFTTDNTMRDILKNNLSKTQ